MCLVFFLQRCAKIRYRKLYMISLKLKLKENEKEKKEEKGHENLSCLLT
jgi:hypothetical protein